MKIFVIIISLVCINLANLLACNISEYNAQVFGEIELVESYIDKKNDNFVKDSILLQLNYLNGLLNSHSDKTVISISPDIQLNGRAPFKNQNELEVKIHHPIIRNHYINKALEDRVIKKDVALIRQKYQAKISIATCSINPKAEIDQALKFIPKDPYLAYWYVHPSKWITKEYINLSSEKVNPCSTKELADFPEPLYFWYFYSVKSNECKKNVSENAAQIRMNNLSQQEKIRKNDYKLGNKVSIVFGIIDHAFHFPNVKKFSNYLRESFFNDKIDKEAMSLLGSDEESLIWFVNELKNNNYQLDTINNKENHIVLELKNKEKEVSLYFGPTDSFAEQKAEHDAFVNKAFRKSTSVIYWGHAGLGENFQLDRLVKTASSKLKTIGFISCYSYRYFNASQTKNKNINLLLTHSAVVNGAEEIINALNFKDKKSKKHIQSISSHTFLRHLL